MPYLTSYLWISLKSANGQVSLVLFFFSDLEDFNWSLVPVTVYKYKPLRRTSIPPSRVHYPFCFLIWRTPLLQILPWQQLIDYWDDLIRYRKCPCPLVRMGGTRGEFLQYTYLEVRLKMIVQISGVLTKLYHLIYYLNTYKRKKKLWKDCNRRKPVREGRTNKQLLGICCRCS